MKQTIKIIYSTHSQAKLFYIKRTRASIIKNKQFRQAKLQVNQNI